MQEWGPVVVGLDGSACGRAALRYGIAEAQRTGTGLELVYAPEWPYLHNATQWWAGREPGEQPLSEGLAEVRHAAPDLKVVATVADASASDVLITRSATATAVVVGAHGAHGFGTLHLGATSVQVALHGRGPVVVVPGGEHRLDGPVVVGVDESEGAGLALWYALRAASLRGTELVVVHAWQPPRPQWPHRIQPLPGSFEELEALQRKVVDAALERWHSAFPDVPVRRRLLPGEPAPTLLAASARAGLLVVGAHGVGALRGPWVGSVARCVLEKASCPVAVVHPHPHQHRPDRPTYAAVAAAHG
jgi:nucleotide-binding universal stress UspA family protein